MTKEDVLLAERIKRLRREREWTQAELSDLLGMNTSYITQVEAKQQGLSLPMVYRLAKVFHLSLKEFFSLWTSGSNGEISNSLAKTRNAL